MEAALSASFLWGPAVRHSKNTECECCLSSNSRLEVVCWCSYSSKLACIRRVSAADTQTGCLSYCRENLEQDLLFWQQLEYIPTVQDLFHQARNHPSLRALPNTRRLVEIRNNIIRFPLMPEGPKQYYCDGDCDPQLAGWVEGMRYGVTELKLTFPDVLFMLNTDDAPVCNQEQVMTRECRIPIISLSKEVHMADLIGPVMKQSDATVIHRYRPWHEKKDKAFFRGVPSCGDMPFPPLCARTLVARLAQVNYSDVLDAGLVEEYSRPDQIKGDPVLRDGNGSLPVLPKVPMTVLPDYKYLLNLDGHSAAYRLAQLLATNSLVLKQHSNMVEYYYRSLRPFHHYVPIFKASEHDFMPRLEWAMTHEGIVRHIISNANHFALKYTTYEARIYYWVYVLTAYKRLFSDQDQYFQPTPSSLLSETEIPAEAQPDAGVFDLLLQHMRAEQQVQSQGL
eukprot:GHUV01045544.1.p1 GENE.GHUV01045544.1~~GHUV01045544.1.p1  ORF type:complete len:452 (+),score=103.73 GHUV01045544.1:108-1463(+)